MLLDFYVKRVFQRSEEEWSKLKYGIGLRRGRTMRIILKLRLSGGLLEIAKVLHKKIKKKKKKKDNGLLRRNVIFIGTSLFCEVQKTKS